MGIRINMEHKLNQLETQIRGVVRKIMVLEERLNRKEEDEKAKSNKKTAGDSDVSSVKRPSKSKRKAK